MLCSWYGLLACQAMSVCLSRTRSLTEVTLLCAG